LLSDFAIIYKERFQMVGKKQLQSTGIVIGCALGIVIVSIVGIIINGTMTKAPKSNTYTFDSGVNPENENIDVTKEGHQQTLTVREGPGFFIKIAGFCFGCILLIGLMIVMKKFGC